MVSTVLKLMSHPKVGCDARKLPTPKQPIETLISWLIQLLKVISSHNGPCLRPDNCKINCKKKEKRRRKVFGLWVIQRNRIWQQQVVKITFISIKTGLWGNLRWRQLLELSNVPSLKHGRQLEKKDGSAWFYFSLVAFQDLISFPFPLLSVISVFFPK